MSQTLILIQTCLCNLRLDMQFLVPHTWPQRRRRPRHMATEVSGIAAVEKKFAVDIVYNGVTRAIMVQPEEEVRAILARAIALFGITQNPHLLSLFREDGTVVPENESAERAGLKPGEVLLLRPNAVKG